jgi:NAD(P)-dependent dehydrogenase (short-subunit alcohol dehydrogenase family)
MLNAMELVTTHFGFSSTAVDVLEAVNLTGKRAIVTGGASGIGVETARALATAGAFVVLAVRNTEAGGRAAADITSTSGNDNVDVVHLDLADLSSVKAFLSAWESPLDILVNNAGIMAVPELERTAQHHELQFGTNFLGHFALTAGLHRWLAVADGARVVSVSSNAHYFSPVVFDDVDYRSRPYDPWSAYGQSKTADILLAVGLTRRWADDGIYANALNPGAIATNLQRYTGGLQTPEDRRKTPAQGAATSVLLASSPLLEGIGGRYFEDCNEAEVVSEPVMFGGGVAPFAVDVDHADRLWDMADHLVT